MSEYLVDICGLLVLDCAYVRMLMESCCRYSYALSTRDIAQPILELGHRYLNMTART
jgi:hypothetical protein